MTPQSKVVLEVCVASVEDAVAAQAGGADRLELNVGLELGGLTPGIGLLQEVKRVVSLPVVAMIRPRAAGFRYSAADKRVMVRDAEQLLAAGADGIVSGALREHGTLDDGYWAALRKLAADRDLVFHRAIDVVDDAPPLLQQLIDTGTTRVLTSGGCRTAWEGRETIARLQKASGSRIEILAGSGINPDNAARLLSATGIHQVHGSFSQPHNEPAGCVADSSYPATCQQRVAAARAALDEYVKRNNG